MTHEKEINDKIRFNKNPLPESIKVGSIKVLDFGESNISIAQALFIHESKLYICTTEYFIKLADGEIKKVENNS